MNKNYIWLLVASLTIFFQLNVKSQDTIKIKKLTSPVEFDGRPFEEAWDGLDIFPMTMHQPNFGSEPTEKSETMVTYDDKYLWIGGRFFMQDATKIVVYGKKRDDTGLFFDSFNITLDTYHDKENAMVFHTNPAAVRADYTIANDGLNGGAGFNRDWNTFWDVKTSRDDKGWYMEMRIPFSSLRFKPVNNITTMGLMLRRFISYTHGIDTYPALNPKDGTSKPSLGVPIQFEGLVPSNPVYISPYVIGGFSRDWIKNTEGTEYIKKDKPEFNAGLDVKYNINSNLTLDLTANTDFAQVEADNQQVNLTRYSLFFPEKRMFFQERSSLFSYGLGGNSNLFYTRNIGLSSGQAIRIYGGTRLVGRVGKWDIGLLDMQTEEYGEKPGENFGVLRLRKQVINSNSYVGGIFTSRLSMSGAQNFAYGLDAIFRLFRDDYLDIKAAQTYDSKINNEINSINPMFLSAKWERRSERGLAYMLGYSYSGQKFKPGMGFVNMGSLQGFSGNIKYGLVPGKESKIFYMAPNISLSRYIRLEDGKLESLALGTGWVTETKKGYTAKISLSFQQEGVLSDFPISDNIKVLAGNYSFTSADLSLATPGGKRKSATFNAGAGQFYDGQNYSFSLTPNYNVSASLQLSGAYEYNHIQFTQRSQKVDIHIASARILYMYSTKLSASVFVQYVSTYDNLISNFRFRYNPHEGNDFYLVFNDYRGISNEVFVPALPNYYNRTILLKYTYTFRL
jgi:hypothetical protein